tara:strand:- start:1319 stop:1789 length:471 start_codon:yes stop_codon:yes gene_type:complete
MKHNEKYLTETLDILKRKFGEPLPTLEDTMKAHALKKEGGPGSGRKAKPGSAKDIDNKMSKAADDANARLDAAERELKKKKMKKEGPDDVRFARRALSKIAKHEGALRKAMFELEQAFLRDPRPENQKLAKQIKKSYKQGVTSFMRDSVQMIKRMK